MKRRISLIRDIWPTPEDMEKDIIIDLKNQTIINKKTNLILKPFFTGGRKTNNTYFTIAIYKNKIKYNIKIHLIFFYSKYRYIPEQVDHIDRNKHNNNINNLRSCTKQLNSFNREKFKLRKNKPMSSKYKSVCYAPKQLNKWVARIRLNNKLISLGSFKTEDLAGEAVNQYYIKNNLAKFAVMNDTPQERARKNIQFDPLPPEMNHIKDLFLNIEPLVDFK